MLLQKKNLESGSRFLTEPFAGILKFSLANLVGCTSSGFLTRPGDDCPE